MQYPPSGRARDRCAMHLASSRANLVARGRKQLLRQFPCVADAKIETLARNRMQRLCGVAQAAPRVRDNAIGEIERQGKRTPVRTRCYEVACMRRRSAPQHRQKLAFSGIATSASPLSGVVSPRQTVVIALRHTMPSARPV